MLSSLTSACASNEKLDFIVTSLELEIFDGFTTHSGREVFSVQIPVFTEEIVFDMAEKILRNVEPLSELTKEQEQSLRLLAKLAGPIPRQVEHILSLFKENYSTWKALIGSALPSDREQFASALLAKSLEEEILKENDFVIKSPDGANQYDGPVQKIAYLRFVLWCCSRASFDPVTDANKFLCFDHGGTAVTIPVISLTTVGYAVHFKSGMLEPSTLALLRGAYKYRAPRIAKFMLTMISLDLESTCGLQNEQMHLQWEMMMREVWHQLHVLEQCSSRIPLTKFYDLRRTDLTKSNRTMPWENLDELLVDVSYAPCDPPKVEKDYSGLALYFTCEATNGSFPP